MQQSTQQNNTIDETIARIVSITKNWGQILPELNALTKKQRLSFMTDGLDPLTVLDPSAHSLAYSYFITTRCLEAKKEDAIQLYQILSNFVHVFTPKQLYLSPTQLKLVGLALVHLADLVKQPLLPLRDLRLAIERYSRSPLVLTSLHCIFVKACILAKMYTYPPTLLDYNIEIIDTTRNDLDIQSVLEYFYYGSIIHAANKKWNRALESLSIIISAPTQKMISAIQIAAYKKYILISLIHEGQVKSLPKYTASSVEKVCKGQSLPYQQLAEAFKDTNIQAFQNTASQSSNVFESDKHIGLVKQCFQSIQRKKIKELTKVYITVGLNDMAQKIGSITPQQLELVLIEMIDQGDILACISVTEQNIKMVHFNDVEEEKQNKLEESILNVSNINNRILYMDKLEGLNREFQTKYMTLSSTGPVMSEQFAEEEMDLPVDDDVRPFAG